MKVLIAGDGPRLQSLCSRLAGALLPGSLYLASGERAPCARPVHHPPGDVEQLAAFVCAEGVEGILVAAGRQRLVTRLGREGLVPIRAGEELPAGVRPLLAALRDERLHDWQVLARAVPRAPLPVISSEAPDCIACGTCCFSASEHYVPLHEEDAARLGPELLARYAAPDARRMRMEQGRCAALQLVGGRFLCAIYERRPQTCRDFQRGETACGDKRRERFMEVPWARRRARPEWLLGSRLLDWRLGVAHGFTTREGGVSTGPLASMNLARRPGERDEHLIENWSRAARALDPRLSASDVALLDQVHGAAALRVERGEGPLATAGAADALVTTTPGVILAVRAADCVPVLLVGPGGVAAVHAGWRGVAAGALPAAVAALAAATDASPATFAAAIGPHIGRGVFEVGEEVVAALAGAGLDPARVAAPGPRGRPHVDLAAAVEDQLLAAGVAEIEQLERCTVTDERLYSHRRDGVATGRQAALIALLPE